MGRSNEEIKNYTSNYYNNNKQRLKKYSLYYYYFNNKRDNKINENIENDKDFKKMINNLQRKNKKIIKKLSINKTDIIIKFN